jgi:hypothetical protein
MRCGRSWPSAPGEAANVIEGTAEPVALPALEVQSEPTLGPAPAARRRLDLDHGHLRPRETNLPFWGTGNGAPAPI